MKNIILFLGLISTLILTAQTKNVYVEYGVKVYDDELYSKPSQISSYVDKIFNYTRMNSYRFRFGLIINDNGSKFYDLAPSGKGDDFLDDNVHIQMAYLGIVYQIDTLIVSRAMYEGPNVYIKRNLKNNWTLHNETKLIDNYLCYKATNINRIENGAGVFEFPVTAWFCPKLPYNYGPNGYSNLPGLILELQVRNVVFGAKKIDLDSDLNFDTEFLKSAKIITEEELNKKIEEEFEELRKQYGE